MTIDRNTLEAKVREGTGKGLARRLRLTNMIPAVVYGRKMEKPLQISVDPLAVRKAVATPHKYNTLLTLKVEGRGDQLVLLKDFQSDPVTRQLLHADFIGVTETEQVKVNVPVVLVGKAEGVLEGGILEQKRREIEVWALPTAIPERVEADVSGLKIAMALHINEVTLPKGISVKTHVNYTVAVVSAPAAEIVAAPVVAAVPVAGAPGAAAATPAAGAAPAAAAPKKEAKK